MTPIPHATDSLDPATSEQRALLDAKLAYDRGDFAAARKTCRALLISTDPKVTSEARRVLRRTNIDPAQVFVLAGCLAFLLWTVWGYAL